MSQPKIPTLNKALLVYLAFIVVFTFYFTLFVKPLHAHYFIFTHAAQEMFSGINPYGKPFGGSSYTTYWLYSPLAALVFYGFSKFPDLIGAFIYMALSSLIFYSGLYQLCKKINIKFTTPFLAMFLFILINEIIGSTQALRVEFSTAGALFWVFSWLVDYRRLFISGVLLAFFTCLKFQPLPVVGLWALTFILLRKYEELTKYLAGFISGLVIFIGSFYFVFPKKFFIEIHQSWFHTLSEDIQATWINYNNIFSYISKNISPISYSTVQFCSLLAALSFAMALVLISIRIKKQLDLFFIALSFGTLYIVLFSPMSQGSTYILATPMLLLGFRCREWVATKTERALWTITLWLYWFFTSAINSDLVPRSWFFYASAQNLRPLGFTILTIAFMVTYYFYVGSGGGIGRRARLRTVWGNP